MARRRDAEDSDGDSEAGYNSDPGPVLRETGRRGSQEPRWWHVSDDQIERLVQTTRRSSGIEVGGDASPSGLVGTLEPPAAVASTATIRPRPTLQGENGRRTVRFQDEQGDALDQMLQAAEQQRQQLEEAGASPQGEKEKAEDSDSAQDSCDGEDDEPVDWSTYPPEERPKDWWRVPDERINKLVRKLAKTRVQKLGGSCTLSTTALATLGGGASPVRGLQRLGACAKSTGPVTLHILVVETGETLSLSAPRCMRAGPGRPPPSNRMTDVFGMGASSRGFETTASFLDCRYRFSSQQRRTRWTAVKASSLKGLIAMATEVEPSRQRLCYRGGSVSLDDMTLRSYGFREGELMELHFLAPPSNSPHAKKEVVLACTRKRTEMQDKPKNNTRAPVSAAGEYGVLRRPDGDVQILPRWNHKVDANIFAKVGIAVDGDGMHKVKPVFGREPIYLPDANCPKLSRVREVVTGHSAYSKPQG